MIILKDVFEQSGAKWHVERALDGYASLIFAFGQTGAGKTYTMVHSPTMQPKILFKPRDINI